MASKLPGGVVSYYKKYSVQSHGIWDRLRRLLAVDPNRSTGIPFGMFRSPPPGNLPQPLYLDPVTAPAGDIAQNPYWQRDVRRHYPRLSVITQNDAAAMLQLGTVAAPQISVGDAGTKELVEVKEGGMGVAEMIAKVGHGDFLTEGGLPPLPGRGMVWAQKEREEAPYPDQYPCRNFS